MKYCIIGSHGFLGSAIARHLGEFSTFPTADTEILFHFGSPVHPPFEQNPDYYMREIIDSFLYLLPFCRDRNIYFIYASSALVYEKTTAFAKCKLILEQLASAYQATTLGLRIFPAYGVGENRTVIAQWCHQMRQGQSPVVYGDGSQKRDFIYIDDVVDQITTLVQERAVGIADIGAGKPVSFNGIIGTINQVLGTTIQPTYVPLPHNYSEGISCQHPLPTKVDIENGIRKCLFLAKHPNSPHIGVMETEGRLYSETSA
jgi:nucleoside-diphosphate-sugar epimerase